MNNDSENDKDGSLLDHPERDERNVAYKDDVLKALGVVKRILGSSERQFSDRRFFLDCVLEFGICYNEWPEGGRWLNYRNRSVFGLQQIPSEFADFAFLLSTLQIGSAAEIGVFRGASSYFLAAVLQRATPTCVYHLVDIVDHLIGYSAFAQHLNIEKRIPRSSKDLIGESFDLIFIDGDHSYGGCITDYLNVGRSARKAVAFHDINAHEFDGLNGGTVRAWKEFREANADVMTVLEFSHSPHRWMGIGIGLQNGFALSGAPAAHSTVSRN